MPALTQDRKTERRLGDVLEDPVKAATVIYGGALVCLDANGKAVPGSDTAGLKVRGVSEDRADNLLGADDAINVKSRRDGLFLLAAAGLTDADIDKPCYIADDQTVQVAVTVNKILAGRIVDVESPTRAWVEITKHGAHVADVVAANAADQTAAYVEADVDSIATLANGNKVTLNALLAELRKSGVIASA